MKLVIGITGATGAIYAVRLLSYLQSRPEVETHVIISKWAKATIEQETDFSVERVEALADRCYDNDDLAAAVSSGSFRHDGMVILPCSMKTLANVATGITNDLIARAADVSIKENRTLVLAVRETPLSAIHLENMLKLSRLGVRIMPPVPNFYSKPSCIDDLVDSFVGRVLGVFGIENDLYTPWQGMDA